MQRNIEVKIVADSVNPAESRLTSFIVTYPRFIHAEFMTHRAFSRNAASSRAIPLKKMIEAVRSNPATFEYWGSNKPGMQAGEALDRSSEYRCRALIDDLRGITAKSVGKLEDLGLHKQNANRYLEPFGHITVLVTAADWAYENFFALRAHPAAQPEFQVLAYRMLNHYLQSAPRTTHWGEWHLPMFKGADDYMGYASWEVILKIATARCARLSYLTFDGDIEPAKDIELHDRLVASGHWSPFEHCAQATDPRAKDFAWTLAHRSNFDSGAEFFEGWHQYRKTFENECRACDLRETLATKPEWVTL